MKLTRGLVALVCGISLGAWRVLGVVVAQSRQMKAVDKAVDEARLVTPLRVVTGELKIIEDSAFSAEKAFDEMAAAFEKCEPLPRCELQADERAWMLEQWRERRALLDWRAKNCRSTKRRAIPRVIHQPRWRRGRWKSKA